MRYVLLDAGHVLENLRLSLKAEGMVCSIHYDFDDERLNRFLGVDEKRETCLACIPVYGKSSTASPEILEVDPLPEHIRAASRVSLKEIFYKEIESVSRSGRKFPDQIAEVRDMIPQLGLEQQAWVPMTTAEPVENEFNFSEAVFYRRSKRNYIDVHLSSARFWRLLDLVRDAAGQDPSLMQTFGTCLGTGFFAENIDGLDSGLYLLNATDRRIGRVRQGRFLRKAATACLDQQWLRNASLHFLFMANLDVLDKTWGPRGYRYAMMLAGRMGQTVYLGAAALGLGACGIGALYDTEANELIGLNKDSALLYLVAAGPVKRF